MWIDNYLQERKTIGWRKKDRARVRYTLSTVSLNTRMIWCGIGSQVTG